MTCVTSSIYSPLSGCKIVMYLSLTVGMQKCYCNNGKIGRDPQMACANSICESTTHAMALAHAK